MGRTLKILFWLYYQKKKKVWKPLRRGLKTGGGSDIPQGTQCGQRPLMSQPLHQPGPQQWTWGVHTILRGAQASGHPLPYAHGASDVLTFQVQETMFLEEPPVTVGPEALSSPREK